MPDAPDRAPLRFGDIAAGDGYIGEVVELPSGRVGLALFADAGRQRQIVFIEGAQCTLVKRAAEWRQLPDRARELELAWHQRDDRSREWGW